LRLLRSLKVRWPFLNESQKPSAKGHPAMTAPNPDSVVSFGEMIIASEQRLLRRIYSWHLFDWCCYQNISKSQAP
jgi:hypothetical protein